VKKIFECESFEILIRKKVKPNDKWLIIKDQYVTIKKIYLFKDHEEQK
jgi:hypothetical protein